MPLRLPALVGAIALLTTAGCALPKAGEDGAIGSLRSQREKAAIREFETRRNQMQFIAAQRAWEQGNAEQCSENLEAVLTRSPDHREAGLLWVELQLLEGNADIARETAQRLAKTYPQDAEVTQALAMADAALAGPDAKLAAEEAADDLDEPPLPGPGLDEQPAAAEVLLTDAEESELPLGPVPLADDDCARAVEAEEPETARPAPSAGPVVAVGHESRSKGKKSPATLPPPVAEQLRIAGEELAAERADEARARVERLLADAPDDLTVTIAAGLWAVRQEHSDWAVAWLTPREAQFLKSAAFHRVLGTALLRADQPLAAERSLRRSLRLDSSAGLTYFLLGSCLERLGRTEAAERHFSQAARLEPRLSVRR